MAKKAEFTLAEQMLVKLLESQPEMLKGFTGSESGGRGAAEFCHGFLKKYMEILKDNQATS